MRYLSVCSGIEAASVAWHPLGWKAAAFSDVEAFPRAVLRHHYPQVPLHGRDRMKGETFEAYAEAAGFQTIGAEEYGPIDLLVGGTPCQSFSVAGKRGGMADGRGNLALEYIRLAYRKRPRWLVWENVPGVFSSNGGEDFRCFLAGLVRWDVPLPDGGWRNSGVVAAGPADGAYGVAWRILDAQFFGVAQRRRRLFVVGHLGDWRRAAAVLFERHSLSGDPAPCRQKGQRPAPTISARPSGGGGLGTDFDCDGGLIAEPAPGIAFSGQPLTCTSTDGVAPTLDTGAEHHNRGIHVAHALRGEGFDASEDGTGRGTPLVPVTCGALTAKGTDEGMGQAAASGLLVPVCFTANDFGADATEDLSPTLRAGGHSGSHANGGVMPAVAIRTANTGANGHGIAEDVAHTLDQAQGQAVAFAIQERAVSENPDAGPDGAGFRSDGAAYTLEARSVPQAVAFDLAQVTSPTNRSSAEPGAPVPTLAADSRMHVAHDQTVAFTDVAGTLKSCGGKSGTPNGAEEATRLVGVQTAVRRLTPRECERLQGFPDDYTRIPWNGWRDLDDSETPEQCRDDGLEVRRTKSGKWRVKDVDGPRYKALGNSMAVPVMAWIGRRIARVEALRLNDARPGEIAA